MTLSEAIRSGQSSREVMKLEKSPSEVHFLCFAGDKFGDRKCSEQKQKRGLNERAGGCRREGWAPLGCPWFGRRGSTLCVAISWFKYTKDKDVLMPATGCHIPLPYDLTDPLIRAHIHLQVGR